MTLLGFRFILTPPLVLSHYRPTGLTVPTVMADSRAHIFNFKTDRSRTEMVTANYLSSEDALL